MVGMSAFARWVKIDAFGTTVGNSLGNSEYFGPDNSCLSSWAKYIDCPSLSAIERQSVEKLLKTLNKLHSKFLRMSKFLLVYEVTLYRKVPKHKCTLFLPGVVWCNLSDAGRRKVGIAMFTKVNTQRTRNLKCYNAGCTI